MFSVSSFEEPLMTTIQWEGNDANMLADQWIVRYSGTDAKLEDLQESLYEFGYEVTGLTSLGGNGYGLLEVDGASYESLSIWASHESVVQYVEPNFVACSGSVIESTVPDDSNLTQLWGLNNTGQTGGTTDADIDAPEAWDIQTGSGNVVIAVIDTGIDYTHPDLVDNMWTNPGEIAGDGIDNDGNGYVDDIYGYDFAYGDSDPFDGNNHGTHVAGTIGGVGDNGLGVTGVNWDVQMMAMKFLSDGGSGSTSAAIQAVNYVTMMKRDYGVNVVATNNSWGGGGYSQALANAIAEGGEEGILFIAAAGNSNNNNDNSNYYPANYDDPCVITVAATDHNDQKASFSSYGSNTVDLGAPGASIYSTISGGGYAWFSGTSMATPHVAGVVGLLAAENPQATAAEIKAAIVDGVDPVASMDGITITGGRLNAYNSLQLIGTGEDLTAPTVRSVTPSGQTGPISRILINFSEAIAADSVVAGNFILKASGDDGIYGTADDLMVTITGQMLSQPAPEVVQIDLPSDLAAGNYRLSIRGNTANPVQDEAGNALRDGRNHLHYFEIIPTVVADEQNDIISEAFDTGLVDTGSEIFFGTIGDGDAGDLDVDIYSVSAVAGTVISADIDTGDSLDELNSFVRVFDGDGCELAFNEDHDGTDSLLEYVVQADGAYYIAVSGHLNFNRDAVDGTGGVAGSTGNYILHLSLSAVSESYPRSDTDGAGNSASGELFAFEDISVLGNDAITSGDDVAYLLAGSNLSGFDFELYGDDADLIYIGSNGIISLDGPWTNWTNTDLSSLPPHATIAPFWDDLIVDGSGSVNWAIRGG